MSVKFTHFIMLKMAVCDLLGDTLLPKVKKDFLFKP